ncbi:uncharacterized protein [Apostichopus japonicus]|uniref:uncharacterized protein isoform X3 n=1 Tax=Stichopus japonicus TaxID=307972 RepID=UPI003AB4D92C
MENYGGRKTANILGLTAIPTQDLCDFEAQFPNTLPEGLRRDVTTSPTEESETISDLTSSTEEIPGLRRDETTSPTEESETISDLTSPTEESDSTSDLTITPDIDSCPPNQVLSTCKCEGSCANPSCSRTCTDITTCVCPAGYLMLNDDCVPLQDCGCYMRHEQTGNETVVPEGEIYTSPRCDKICLCKNDYLTCNVSEGCDPNADCEYRSGIPHCQENQYSDCSQKFTDGENTSGVYEVNPPNWSGPPFEVYCDMSNGGGWTVIQRRMDDTQSFDLGWSDYKAGFGNLSENFWLGNEKIYSLTNQRQYELRIDLGNVDNQKFYAVYDSFSISDESQEYTLRLGSYSGDAGDALSFHKDYPFSTWDNDNDALDADHLSSYYNNIAYQEQGGWWHRNYQLSGYVSSLNSAGWSHESLWHTTEVRMAQINYSDMKIRAIA